MAVGSINAYQSRFIAADRLRLFIPCVGQDLVSNDISLRPLVEKENLVRHEWQSDLIDSAKLRMPFDEH